MSFVVYNPGDRVELIEDYGSRKCGDQGIVIRSVGRGMHGTDLVYICMDAMNQYGSRNVDCYARRLKKVVPEAPETPVAPQHRITNHIGLVVATADRVFPRRSFDTILKSLVEEMGELSTEIAIEQGTKKRAPSPDGVKGEAVDVFIVAVDMLRATWGDKLFTQEFTDKVTSKLAKWEGK